MNPNEIRVEPALLENNAETIRAAAKKIQTALDAVEAEIQRLGIDVFSGERADALRQRYMQLSQLLQSFCPMLEAFSVRLDTAATAFREADRENGA